LPIPDQYKIELRSRNHNTLSRQQIIDAIVRCVPEGWTVDLEGAEAFVLVEVFKVRRFCVVSFLSELRAGAQSVAGVSIVTDYYEHQKFNVMEIAKTKGVDERFKDGEGRVSVVAEDGH
jgi:tRNA acetyltransferase TAN1